jgi:hypothetical protein
MVKKPEFDNHFYEENFLGSQMRRLITFTMQRYELQESIRNNTPR